MRTPRIGIIGGAGQMGQWFEKLFQDYGWSVAISDLSQGVSEEELISSSDIVVISVPIGVAVEVIQRVASLLSPTQLLCDLTSLKEGPLEAMSGCAGEFVGLHPMFGPDTVQREGQTVVWCDGRSGVLAQRLRELFIQVGFKLVEASALEHDKVMAVVQGLNHFHAIVFACALDKLNIDMTKTMPFASPIYSIRMDMMGRIMAQESRLYGEMEILNRHVPETLKVFLGCAQALAQNIEQGDLVSFCAAFESARKNLGDFCAQAFERSSTLLQHVNLPR